MGAQYIYIYIYTYVCICVYACNSGYHQNSMRVTYSDRAYCPNARVSVLTGNLVSALGFRIAITGQKGRGVLIFCHERHGTMHPQVWKFLPSF